MAKKAVVDTNIVLSGLLSQKGAPGQILELWLDHHFIPIISPEIEEEYFSVLYYDHIKNRLGKSFRLALQTLTSILRSAKRVYPKEKIKFFQDPRDDMLVEAAAIESADYIVSGDKSVLNAKEYKNIQILSARAFLQNL